jgi:hypothetical protein
MAQRSIIETLAAVLHGLAVLFGHLLMPRAAHIAIPVMRTVVRRLERLDLARVGTGVWLNVLAPDELLLRGAIRAVELIPAAGLRTPVLHGTVRMRL